MLECPNRIFPIEPHNDIPFITYLPKGIADIIYANFLAKLPIFKQDIRLCLKNVKSFNHFISTGTLVSNVNKLGGSVLLKKSRRKIFGGDKHLKKPIEIFWKETEIAGAECLLFFKECAANIQEIIRWYFYNHYIYVEYIWYYTRDILLRVWWRAKC